MELTSFAVASPPQALLACVLSFYLVVYSEGRVRTIQFLDILGRALRKVTPAMLAEHIDLAALPPESHKLLLLPLDANFN